MLAKNYGGTIRSCAPQQTLQRIQPLIQQAQITRLANLTHLDCIGIPVYTCIRPVSKNLSTSQGKGITDELAICSAYMEALEHYFAESIDIDCVLASDEIKDNYYLHPNELSSGLWNKDFNTNYRYEWSIAAEINSQQDIYVPSRYLCLDTTKPVTETGLFKISTNGLASGNNFAEALCHGMYELVERHATTSFDALTIEEKRRQAIDLNTVDYQLAINILKRFNKKNINTVLYDLTPFALGVPTFYCVISSVGVRKLGRFSGFGTHLHKGVAVCRALTEAVQSRLTHISGSRDDIFTEYYQRTWSEFPEGGENDYRHIINLPQRQLSEQKEYLLQSLAANKYSRVIAYQHTSAACPISVVRVIIPGLLQ